MKVNLDKVLEERDQKLSEVDDRGYAVQAGVGLDDKGYGLQACAPRIGTTAEQIESQKKDMKMMIILGVTIVVMIGFTVLCFMKKIEEIE